MKTLMRKFLIKKALSKRRWLKFIRMGLLLFIPVWVGAQDLNLQREKLVFPLDTVWQTVTAKIDMVDESVQLLSYSVQFGERLVQISAYPAGVPDSTLYLVEDPLTLRRGDLIIEYKLPPTGKEEYYSVAVDFELDGQPLVPAPESLEGAVGRPITVRGRDAIQRIIWTNLLENYINLSGTLTVRLTAVLNGLMPGCLQVNCAAGIPTFNRTPFIIAGAVGAGLIGVGQIFDSKSDDRYEAYENFKPSESPGVDPEEFYQDANGKHHTYLGLTYAGIAVLAVDAAWYLVKELKFRRDRRLFQRCCREIAAVRLQPVIDIPAGSAVGQAGIKLQVNF
jgi:hypothetical protein